MATKSWIRTWEEGIAHFGLGSPVKAKNIQSNRNVNLLSSHNSPAWSLQTIYKQFLFKSSIWIFHLLLNPQSWGLKRKPPHAYCNILTKIWGLFSNIFLNIWGEWHLLLVQAVTPRKVIFRELSLKSFKESSQPEKSCDLQEKEGSNFLKRSTHDPKSEATFNNLSFIFPVLISSLIRAAPVPLQQNLIKTQLHTSRSEEHWKLAAERENRCLLDPPAHKWAPTRSPGPALCARCGSSRQDTQLESPAMCFLVIAPRREPKAELAQKHERLDRVLAKTRGSCAAAYSLQGQSLINWNCLAFKRADEKLWEAIEAFSLAQALRRDQIYIM